MALASRELAENAGAILSITYDTVSLLVGTVTLDGTAAIEPVTFFLYENGVVAVINGQPVQGTVQPGQTQTVALPKSGPDSFSLMANPTGHGNPVLPVGFSINTAT